MANKRVATQDFAKARMAESIDSLSGARTGAKAWAPV
jgi:hypothetical protein